jgi:hypothetical protein
LDDSIKAVNITTIVADTILAIVILDLFNIR